MLNLVKYIKKKGKRGYTESLKIIENQEEQRKPKKLRKIKNNQEKTRKAKKIKKKK